LDKDVWLPSGLLGVDVAGAQDVSWSCICFVWLCLAAKPSHVGADVDRLACFLHRPTVYGWQAWVQCFLTSNALYHHVVVGDGAFPGAVKLPGLDIYYGVDYWGLAP
jgi:hypothetical protein